MSANNLSTSLHEKKAIKAREYNPNDIKEIPEQNVNIPIAELGGQTIYEFNKEMEEAEAEMDRGEFSNQTEVVAKFEKMFQK